MEQIYEFDSDNVATAATTRQLKYMKRLCAEVGRKFPTRPLNKAEASVIIDSLLHGQFEGIEPDTETTESEVDEIVSEQIAKEQADADMQALADEEAYQDYLIEAEKLHAQPARLYRAVGQVSQVRLGLSAKLVAKDWTANKNRLPYKDKALKESFVKQVLAMYETMREIEERATELHAAASAEAIEVI